MNVFPNQAGKTKERQKIMFDKLRNLRKKPVLDELYESLGNYLMAAFANNLKDDPTNKSWLYLNGQRVIGKDGVADFQKIMSEGFTNFEHTHTKYDNKEAFEGFLHWNHLFFYKFYKYTFEPSQQKGSLLVFNGKPITAGLRFGIDDYIEGSISASKHWLGTGRDYEAYDLKM